MVFGNWKYGKLKKLGLYLRDRLNKEAPQPKIKEIVAPFLPLSCSWVFARGKKWTVQKSASCTQQRSDRLGVVLKLLFHFWLRLQYMCCFLSFSGYRSGRGNYQYFFIILNSILVLVPCVYVYFPRFRSLFIFNHASWCWNQEPSVNRTFVMEDVTSLQYPVSKCYVCYNAF